MGGRRKRRTLEELANFELLCELEAELGRQVERDGFESLSDPARTVYAVWWLDADVHNGGFDQYFFNSWGDYASDALRGLEALGAMKTASIVRRALAVFPAPGPAQDRLIRCAQLDALSPAGHDALESLTDEFFKRPEDLESILADFARRHAAELSLHRSDRRKRQEAD